MKNDPDAACSDGCVVDAGLFGEGVGGPPCKMVGVTFRNDLKPTYSMSGTHVSEQGKVYLGHNFTNLSEVRTPAQIGFCKKVFYEPGANTITHLLELLIDLFVVFVILNELHDECPIGKREEFCVLSR